ncbi:hypothetical protein BCV72DRAFT_300944 [Rhizopus microsporus var. microsporus]|uniref:Uncharacterized protein n=1 Tax=Rhizopus microsporus var. microsporus TaxID=86635 RepID=A0A1X0RH78_RHIZD|nr:hypothetical protein BCV72DRAFT_300944 [Rhizopus microsporus var. microsporus]
MPSLADTWNELSNMEGVNLTVARNGISNYGQVISTTCETIATSYNNYYVESFQNTTANYFIYTISTTFPVAKVSTIKYLVYQHIFNEVFSLQLKTVEIPGDILPSTKQDDKRKIQGFVGNLIFEIRNRLPLFPVTKETLNKAPFGIMPALRHMLSKYETLIANNPNPQIQEPEQKPHDKSNTKAKKQKGKKQTKKKFIPPEKVLPSLAEHNASLELNDITAEEVEQYFRPCSIDPERIDVFISYHGGNDIRHLPSSEYYNMHRIVTRQKSEQGLKKRSGL